MAQKHVRCIAGSVWQGGRSTGGVHNNEGSVIGVSSKCATVAVALSSLALQRVVSRAE